MTTLKRIEKGLYWDRALSLVEGCSPVSEGCAHCWSARASYMRANNPNEKIRARHEGLTDECGKWTGKIRLMWKDLAKVTPKQKPQTISIWNDLFHPLVPYQFQIRVFGAMAVADQHTYLILTKRPDLMRKFFQSIEHWLHIGPNVWFGVSVELAKYEWRIQELLKIKGNLFVNFEPLLGPVKLQNVWIKGECLEHCESIMQMDCEPRTFCPTRDNGLGWIIAGCESGPKRRSSNIDDFRLLRDQCQETGVPFFLKQMEVAGKIVHMPELDGKIWDQIPRKI